MDKPSCETCRFWINDGADDEPSAPCHRYPPRFNRETAKEMGEAGDFGIYPWVMRDDWCGEHEPKGEADEGSN
jgi:hypothetical protein